MTAPRGDTDRIASKEILDAIDVRVGQRLRQWDTFLGLSQQIQSAANDEEKAARLAVDRFASLRLVTSVDILVQDNILVSLGSASLATATFQRLGRENECAGTSV